MTNFQALKSTFFPKNSENQTYPPCRAAIFLRVCHVIANYNIVMSLTIMWLLDTPVTDQNGDLKIRSDFAVGGLNSSQISEKGDKSKFWLKNIIESWRFISTIAIHEIGIVARRAQWTAVENRTAKWWHSCGSLAPDSNVLTNLKSECTNYFVADAIFFFFVWNSTILTSLKFLSHQCQMWHLQFIKFRFSFVNSY